MENLSLRSKFGRPSGANYPQGAIPAPLVPVVNGRFRSLYDTLDEDTVLKLDRAVLYGNVGAFEDALALIASIAPELQCSGVVSVEHSLILWNQGEYLQAAEILRRAIAFARREGKDVDSHSIHTLIRLLLGHVEYKTEGDFTAARDSMRETREWLQNVAIEKLDDVQIYALYRYYLHIDCASPHLGFKSEHFTVIPHIEEAAEGSRLSNLRQFLQNQGRLSESYRILAVEINHLLEEVTKQDSIQSFLSYCSPLDSEPVWFVEGQARLLLAVSFRLSGKIDQADEQFRKSRKLFQEAPVPEGLNHLELTVRLEELSHTGDDPQISLTKWVRFLEDDSALLHNSAKSTVLQNIVNTAEEILKSSENSEVRGMFWRFYRQIEAFFEKTGQLASLYLYRISANQVAFSSGEFGSILLWHDKFDKKHPRFNSSLHLRLWFSQKLNICQKAGDTEGTFQTMGELNKLFKDGTEFWGNADGERNDTSTAPFLQNPHLNGLHPEWSNDRCIRIDEHWLLRDHKTDSGSVENDFSTFVLGSQNLGTKSANSRYRTVLRWLREAVDSQEIVQEELEQILLLDTESSTEIDAKTLLQEITTEGLAERLSRLSTTRWIGTFEKLSNWLLKKSKQPEVQRHHLLVFLAHEFIVAGSAEAKIEGTKRLLDLIPQLNQTATQSFSITDLRNNLASAMRVRLNILSQEQGIPCALENEKSEEFLEILGLFETSLQENRDSGDLQRQYHNLQWIAGLCFGPAVRLQPLSLYRFFDSFYTAEAIAQKHVQSWAGLTGRSKVHKMLLATELANKFDLTLQGIRICLNFSPSNEQEGNIRIWHLIQNMKSRGFGWLMNAYTLAPKETGLRTLEKLTSSEWVPMVSFDDMRFIADDSCSDVVFVDWSGELDYDGLSPPLLVTCYQGCAPNIWSTKMSWREVHDVIDKFASLGTEDLKAKDADELLKQLQPLVQPLAHATKPGQTLVFCPAGNLHRIPLHALELDGDVLIQRNPIVYCSSLTALKAAFQSRKQYESRGGSLSRESGDVGEKWKASLFGGSAQAFTSLQSLGNKFKAQSFSGDSFTASNFRSEISSGTDLLHYHGHGEFTDEDPSKQCLLFGHGDESLTIDDIYDLSPAPRSYHATLLACGSGLSRTNLSNDVIGLVPAFLYSGAASTVSTLWKFDDSDAALFSDLFYSSFNMSLSGQDEIRVDLAKALQSAVLAIRERKPELYHWAPFVLHGHWMFKARSRGSRSEEPKEPGQVQSGGDGESTSKEECEKLLGEENLDTLANLTISAVMLQDQGKYKEAEEMNRRVLNGKEKVLGKGHLETLISVTNLGVVLQSQGKYAEAEAMQRRALEGLESKPGKQHPVTLTCMGRLALVLQDECKYREAEALNQQVLEGYEKVLGMDHPDTLACINNQALVLQKLCKYEEAETTYRQLLQRYEKALGKEHPHNLISIGNLAVVLQLQGKYEEAEATSRDALKGSEKTLGMDHPNTLMSVCSLASLLHLRKQYDASSDLYQRASDGFEIALGPSHPRTIACNNGYNSLRQEMTILEADSLSDGLNRMRTLPASDSNLTDGP